MAKGVGKTIVNGVKGMFTNSEGKFSLGKTLLSIGTAALCIAFPAVGVVACGIGAVMGAVQVGKGVYNAATADTDAQAREAWQNVGGGVFTVATSAIGAKAGAKAVTATSKAKGGLASLADDASLGKKAVAFAKDMASSTAERGKAILESGKNVASGVKTTADSLKEINQMRKANAEALAKQAKGEALTEAEQNAISNWNFLKDAYKSLKQERSTIKDVIKGTNTGKAFSQNQGETLLQTLKTNFSKEGLSSIAKGLSADKQAIVDAIKNSSATYSELVSKYGYENVLEVMDVLVGTMVANEAA